MQTEPEISVSMAEAEAFARRFGLTRLPAPEIERLREAMATIARAGLEVPRVASKFVAPAPVFSVAFGTNKKES